MPQQKINFSDEIWQIVKSYSHLTGMTEAEIARIIFLLGLPHFAPTIASIQSASTEQASESVLTATIVKLLAGADVPESELSIAGYQAGISLEDMCRLRDCLKGKGKGGKNAVLHR